MKTISGITLLSLTAMFASPQAQAGDRTRALIGGLIGGVILSEVLHDSNVHTSVSVGYHSDHGYFEWVEVKTWVPGYYERRCDRYGRYYEVWVPGYETYTNQRIWVESPRRHGHRHHNRFYDRHEDRHHGNRNRDNRRHSNRGGAVRRY